MTKSKLGFWGACPALAVIATLAIPSTAEAHVKWFSDYDFADPPLDFSEVLTPAFWWLAVLSMAVIAITVLLQPAMERLGWTQRFDRWAEQRGHLAVAALRIGTGATLVWSWQVGTLLAPELFVFDEWLLWLEFCVAFLLIFQRTLRWAGLGIFALYGIAAWRFGFFHMLDYLMFVGVGYFFIAHCAKREWIRNTALPAVYVTVGFCLFWLGIEKMVYPSWSQVLLAQHPVLALGLDPNFFLIAAAFVEVSLGFMIMACLQQRLLALTITLVFFLTTLVFGRAEVVGHTLIHSVLVVFLIAGAGSATPPLQWLPNLNCRAATAAVGFLVLLAAIMIPYVLGAKMRYESTASAGKATRMHAMTMEVGMAVGEEGAPELAIAVHKDPVAGWNLELVTENFEFSPGAAGLKPVAGQGHAHLYIDGRKVARLYAPWHHIASLTPGSHQINVTLNANNHATLTVAGKRVSASATIEVARDAE